MDDLYSLHRAVVLYADVNGFVTSQGVAVSYLCFRRHVWKAQQWLGYVSSASSSSARLSSGGRLFRAKAEPAFRNLTCLNPLGGRELRAVEETSLNHTCRESRHTFQWGLVKWLPLLGTELPQATRTALVTLCWISCIIIQLCWRSKKSVSHDRNHHLVFW